MKSSSYDHSLDVEEGEERRKNTPKRGGVSGQTQGTIQRPTSTPSNDEKEAGIIKKRKEKGRRDTCAKIIGFRMVGRPFC